MRTTPILLILVQPGMGQIPQEMKSDLALLTGCQKELAASQATLSSLVHSNNTVSSEQKQQEIPPLCSAQLPSTEPEPTYSEALQSDMMLADERNNGCNFSEPTEPHDQDDVYEEPVNIQKHPPVYERTFTNSRHHTHIPASAGAPRKPVEKREGPAKPHRTSAQGGLVFGKGTAPGLQAARPQRRTSNNRVCSGVFVTNLMPKTTAVQLERYIKRETGHIVPVEKLQTRYNTYSSFYIRCEQPMRKELLSPFLWPEDTKVKLYFS